MKYVSLWIRQLSTEAALLLYAGHSPDYADKLFEELAAIHDASDPIAN